MTKPAEYKRILYGDENRVFCVWYKWYYPTGRLQSYIKKYKNVEQIKKNHRKLPWISSRLTSAQFFLSLPHHRPVKIIHKRNSPLCFLFLSSRICYIYFSKENLNEKTLNRKWTWKNLFSKQTHFSIWTNST